MKFKLHAPFKATGDQPDAIRSLITGLDKGLKHQVLLGVTGSGKTFTMASVIAKVNKPALIISHNKTLAAQLYQEFKQFFPANSVCYFVSYYDYYQPEAYIPQTDTYIEKETEINEEIDKLRLSATTNLLTRKDTIIVASVSCIYNLGSPRQYGQFIIELMVGMNISRESIVTRLVELQYENADYGFHRSTFRIRGNYLDVFLAYEETALRIVQDQNKIIKLIYIDPLNGNKISEIEKVAIYPAKHYLAPADSRPEIFAAIRKDLDLQISNLRSLGKLLEAHRLSQKVNYDLEMIQEVGFVNGIENYSRYFDGRKPGQPPFTLLDYFKEPYGSDWLLFIDESHMTVPQIRGMYYGDRSRKQTLIDFGFRLPSAADNRPLTFLEFQRRTTQTIYVSATPSDWEVSMAKEQGRKTSFNGVAEQLIRPTGIVDPVIMIRPTTGQIKDLCAEIISRKKRGERVLVTTLTKKMAEDLADFITSRKYQKLITGLKEFEHPIVQYLHSDVKTLERSDILDDLRSGKYDCLIGINLLREGLDLPEVSLVAILDADKEGFLRSKTALIQTMGRAARHIQGTVIMYADVKTASMTRAISEITRRRLKQLSYNKLQGIIPASVIKPIREKLVVDRETPELITHYLDKSKKLEYQKMLDVDINQLTPLDKSKFIKRLNSEMTLAAQDLNFELAIEIRDKIRMIKENFF